MRLPRISLPFGVIVLLGALVGFYLLHAMSRAFRFSSVYNWFGLRPASVGEGEVWRLLTHALLPVGFFDLLISGVMIVWLGSRVARVWSGTDFFLYLGICATGAGLAGFLTSPASSETMLGTAVLVLALLVSWARMFGHERIRLMATWEMRAFTLALVLGLAMVLIAGVTAGWRQGLYLLGSAGAGWVYLSLRWKANRAQPAQPVDSGRINRLEL